MDVEPELIVARLRAIREPRMRVCALIEALGGGDPGAWMQALAALIARAHGSDDAAELAELAELASDAALPEPLRLHAAQVRAVAAEP